MYRWYFGIPLIGLLLFGGLYWQFQRRHAAEERVAAEAAEVARLEELQRLEEARREAIEQQRRLIEQRRLAREEERRREEAAQQLRLELESERSAALSRAIADERTIVNLEQKLAFEEDMLGRAQAQQSILEGELRFLEDYVPEAQRNQERILEILKDYRTAEQAREEVRRQALLPEAETRPLEP